MSTTYKSSIVETRQQMPAWKLKAMQKAEENIALFARNRTQGISDADTLAILIANPKTKVFVGLWGDDREPDYCGVRVIKGEAHFAHVGDVEADSVDAIHCSCPEEAEAMRQVFGDDKGRRH
jgi:hypothetical protein